MVLEPAGLVCRTVASVLLAVIGDEYEQLDGSALHHEYTELFWASQWLTKPAMHANIHSLMHTHTLLVSERTVAAIVWPEIGTNFIEKSSMQVA